MVSEDNKKRIQSWNPTAIYVSVYFSDFSESPLPKIYGISVISCTHVVKGLTYEQSNALNTILNHLALVKTYGEYIKLVA